MVIVCFSSECSLNCQYIGLFSCNHVRGPTFPSSFLHNSINHYHNLTIMLLYLNTLDTESHCPSLFYHKRGGTYPMISELRDIKEK